MAKKIEKKWFQSKTKVGALLIGIGPVLMTVGAMLSGQLDLASGMASLSTEIGIVLGILGIRDLPFINKQ